MARYRDFDVDLVDCGPMGYLYQFTHIDYDGPEDRRSGTGFATEVEARNSIDEYHSSNMADEVTAMRAYLREIEDTLFSIVVCDRFSVEHAFKIQRACRALSERSAGARKDS